MRYDELVRRGREVAQRLSKSQWELGDLALKVVPMGEQHKHNGSIERLQQYADEIGVAFDALDLYRRVAAAWPDRTRIRSASWSVHRELMSHPQRGRILEALVRKHERVTVDLARRHRGKEPTRYEPPPRTITEKVEAVKDYLADKDVREVVATDPKAGMAVSLASAERSRRMAEQSEEREEKRQQKAGPLDLMFQVLGHVHKSRYQLQAAAKILAGHVDRMDAEVRDEVAEAIAINRELIELISATVERGDLSISDQELERLLNAE